MCHFNLMMFYPDLSEDDIEAADSEQAAMERAALKSRVCRSYSGLLTRQREGPMMKFVVPHGHSRVSQSRLVQCMLNDWSAVKCIDFDALELMLQTEPDAAEDEVPLNLHPILAAGS